MLRDKLDKLDNVIEPPAPGPASVLRITLTIDNLRAGGAERVLVRMANYWAAQGQCITILTTQPRSEPPFYALDQRIHFVPLGTATTSPNKLTGFWNNLRRILVLRQAIIQSQPDVVISFLERMNVNTILATRGLPVPVIVDEQIHPAMYPLNKVWARLRHILYPQAQRVVGVTERVITWFPPAIQRISSVIPNPVEIPHAAPLSSPVPGTTGTSGANGTKREHIVLGMGRLVDQKGFDLLIKAFACIAPRHPDWTLEIWGEGRNRVHLEALRDRLGLHDRIRLPGRTQEPFTKMRQADVFVLSSRYEGFPNVLCEALTCGLPIISFDCLSGPREIIRAGIDGILVAPEDVAALALAMHRLMSDASLRQTMAARAPEVLERFGMEPVMQLWERLIADVLCETGSAGYQRPGYSSVAHNKRSNPT